MRDFYHWNVTCIFLISEILSWRNPDEIELSYKTWGWGNYLEIFWYGYSFLGSIRGGKGAKLPIYCWDGDKGKGESLRDSPILCIWLASKMNWLRKLYCLELLDFESACFLGRNKYPIGNLKRREHCLSLITWDISITNHLLLRCWLRIECL